MGVPMVIRRHPEHGLNLAACSVKSISPDRGRYKDRILPLQPHLRAGVGMAIFECCRPVNPHGLLSACRRQSGFCPSIMLLTRTVQVALPDWRTQFQTRGSELLWLRLALIDPVGGQKALPQLRHVGRETLTGIQHARLIVVLLASARADMTQQRGSHDHQVRPIGR
jgi:hypothetical protein